MDLSQQLDKFNQMMEFLFIGKIVFAVIALVGLVIAIYSKRANNSGNARNGIIIFILGVAVAIGLHMFQEDSQKKLYGYPNTYFLK